MSVKNRRESKAARRTARKLKAEAPRPGRIVLSTEHAALLESAHRLKESIGELPTKTGMEIAARFSAMCLAVDVFLEKAGLNPIEQSAKDKAPKGKQGRVIENADGTVDVVENTPEIQAIHGDPQKLKSVQ